jgi:hypothetical protein
MMLRKASLLLALTATLALALAPTDTAFASAYQTVDISTGVNVGAAGNPLYPAGGRDDFWRVRAVPGNASLNAPAWIILMGTGWNTIPGAQPIFGNNNAVGTSEYERCFCLQSAEKAQLTLTFRADNKANLFLNSYFANPIVQALANNTFAGNVQPVQFTYTAQNGLRAGRNCLRVRVNNEGGPTGFALKAALQGFGAQDASGESCCGRGEAVFSEAFRGAASAIDPGGESGPVRDATPVLEAAPVRAAPGRRPND